jgi:hypothetical protein
VNHVGGTLNIDGDRIMELVDQSDTANAVWCCLPSHTPNFQIAVSILLDDCFYPQNGQIAFDISEL